MSDQAEIDKWVARAMAAIDLLHPEERPVRWIAEISLGRWVYAEAPTPALALLIAIVKAKLAA